MSPDPNARQAGFALLGVLWALALLALLIEPVIVLSREATFTARVAQRDSRLRWQMEAALANTIYEILLHHATSAWPIDGSAWHERIGDLTLAVSIDNESGKIDLNAAPAELFENLLRAAGLPEADALHMAQAIVEWRTPAPTADALHTSQAASEDVARKPIRHGAFESVDELEQVAGFTKTEVERLRRNLTVFSPRGVVDRTTAPRLVRIALNGGVLAQTAEAQSDEAVKLSALPALGGHNFTIRVEANAQGSINSGIEETVRFVDGGEKHYHILARRYFKRGIAVSGGD